MNNSNTNPSTELCHMADLITTATLLMALFIVTTCTIVLSMTTEEIQERPIAWCGTVSNHSMPTKKLPFGDAFKGKELFENNCASCHNIHKSMVGPALKGILTRRELPWIVKWVQNPAKVVASKDPYALKLVADYESAGLMTGFAALKKADIENIIAYVGSYE
ncbi:MAG TPA: cytochrome c [Cytophagales bacterium]|nr:cytochrome c [Cytophagales bacterium]